MALTPTNSPAPVSTGAVPAGAPPHVQQLGEVVVEQVPERIAQLARTIILTGTIAEQQPGGALVLRTQVGELIIRSPVPLPPDKILSLQIPPGAPPVRAQVSVAQPVSGVPAPVSSTTATPPPLPGTSAAPPPVTAMPRPLIGLPVGQPIGQPIGLPGVSLGGPLTNPAQAPVLPSPLAPPVSLPAVLPAPSVPFGAPLPSPLATSGTSVTPAPTVHLSAPVAPLAATIAAQAITQIPIVPGTVLPAQILALPDIAQEGNPLRTLLPPSVQAFVEVQKLGAPALQALLPQGLAEVLKHLPPGVINSPPGPAASYEPHNMSAAATTSSQSMLAAPSVAPRAAVPAFASLPVLLTLPPGSQVTVQVDRVFPPGQSVPPLAPQPATPNAPQPPVFTAVVVGQTPQGEPMATSPAGLLVLDNRAPLAPGSTVEVSVLHVKEPAVEADMPTPLMPRDWPSLQQALASMPNPPPSALAHLARPENLGGVVAFLVAALKLAQPQKVAGDELTRHLRNTGQETLLTRVLGEVQQVGQSFARETAQPQDWRSLALPVFADGQLTRLAVHMRSEREADSNTPLPNVKRLVVEVELSRLGPLLLDGFIRQKRFDLTLRSQRRLPKSLRDEVRLAYSNALTALGWQGGMEFQTAAELWLKG